MRLPGRPIATRRRPARAVGRMTGSEDDMDETSELWSEADDDAVAAYLAHFHGGIYPVARVAGDVLGHPHTWWRNLADTDSRWGWHFGGPVQQQGDDQ